MDKNDKVYREHSAKEHLILAVMILLAFFFLTSQYNSTLLPSLTSGTLTGAATTVISKGSLVVWGVIMLLLIMGIIAGFVMWWKNKKDKVLLFRRENYPFLNYQKNAVQKILQPEVQMIGASVETAKKSSPAVDILTRRLTKVQQELVNIPLRSAVKGHIINAISEEYLEEARTRPISSFKIKSH